jgi:hypothetical protein
MTIDRHILSLGYAYTTDYIANWPSLIMRKHRLVELQKIIAVRIGSLTKEVEIATNVKLNPL